MSEQQPVQITEADGQALAAKLSEFSKSLAPGEQACLAMLLQRATEDTGEDVQGYGQYPWLWNFSASNIVSQGGGNIVASGAGNFGWR